MRRLVVLGMIVAGAIAACSGRGPQSVGAQPSWRAPKAARVAPVGKPVTFAPAGAPVLRYNEPASAPPKSALGDAVIAAVQDAAVGANTPVPIADARLFRACAQLAEVVPEDGVIANSLVEFALQRNGIIEPSPYLLVVWGDLDSPDLIVEQFKPNLAEALADGATARIGIGTAVRAPDGTGAVVFALQGSGVTTQPIPRSIAAGGAFTIDAVIDAGYRSPEVFITRNSGATERLDLEHGATGAFKARVACGSSTGRQQVEITASGAQGSTVLANFPVWCAATPPVSLTIHPTIDDAPVVDALEAEKRLLALVNRDRLAAGLHALLWDERVAVVSRAHSEDMRRTGFVAHLSPTTGSAADRVRAANIKTAVVLENVARAYGLGEAHNALMNSPGHRANLTSDAATHLGIGIVFGEEVSGRRELLITQVFTRIPPKVDPARTAAQIRDKINDVTRVDVNAKLVSIAQQLAEQLAAGKTREQAYPAVRRQVDALGHVYSRVGTVITAAADIDSLDGKSLLGGTLPNEIGVGIAQGNHPEIGEGAIWIVLLLGSRR